MATTARTAATTTVARRRRRYFTRARVILWIGDLIVVAVAAGLTAIRVALIRTGEPSAPPRTWGPPGPQWAPQPPYGPPQQYGPPHPYGPPPGPSANEPPG